MLQIGNLSSLLDIMNEKEPELRITVKKLVTISLMEIFKDLIPAYQIKHQDLPLKKCIIIFSYPESVFST